VVRALDARHAAPGLLHDPRAAVAAGVEERVRLAVVVGHHEHALAPDLDHDEVAALAQLIGVRDGDPAAHQDVLELPLQDAVVREGSAGQRGRAFERFARALQLADRQGQRRVAYGHGSVLSSSAAGGEITRTFVRLAT
jgi:hypothetical protein